MDGLKCFQRDEFTPVPGCAGHGKKDWDYCYDPTGSTELSGGNDNDATGLEACIGECDNDGQCKDGLKCFQRDKGETIPGCTGPGAGKDWDYCYDPSWTPGATTPAAAPAEEPKIVIKEAETGDWGGAGGPKKIWAICGPQDVAQVVEVESGDWGEAECPAGTEVLGGGCQAYRGPHIMQASMIRGKGAWRTSYKCGGQDGDKRVYAMCAPPMGVNVIREHGGDWHQVMCPAGQTVVGGGCDAKKSPYKFEYNGPVIDGDRTGWKCGGHSGDKKVKVACKPDSARAERAPPR